jgi:hypothetical protein
MFFSAERANGAGQNCGGKQTGKRVVLHGC